MLNNKKNKKKNNNTRVIQVTEAAVDVHGVATCSGSDTTVIITDAGGSRKASSLDDLTRLKVAGVDDASLERTVSLNFRNETSASAASRQLTNLAVQVTLRSPSIG